LDPAEIYEELEAQFVFSLFPLFSPFLLFLSNYVNPPFGSIMHAFFPTRRADRMGPKAIEEFLLSPLFFFLRFRKHSRIRPGVFDGLPSFLTPPPLSFFLPSPLDLILTSCLPECSYSKGRVSYQVASPPPSFLPSFDARAVSQRAFSHATRAPKGKARH